MHLVWGLNSRALIIRYKTGPDPTHLPLPPIEITHPHATSSTTATWRLSEWPSSYSRLCSQWPSCARRRRSHLLHRARRSWCRAPVIWTRPIPLTPAAIRSERPSPPSWTASATSTTLPACWSPSESTSLRLFSSPKHAMLTALLADATVLPNLQFVLTSPMIWKVFC